MAEADVISRPEDQALALRERPAEDRCAVDAAEIGDRDRAVGDVDDRVPARDGGSRTKRSLSGSRPTEMSPRSGRETMEEPSSQEAMTTSRGPPRERPSGVAFVGARGTRGDVTGGG